MILEWILHNTDSLVAAANFTAATFLVVLAGATVYIVSTREFKPGSVTPYILLGVAVEAVAWAIHRTYWGVWRTLRDWGYVEWDKWFVANGYLALVPISLVLIGIAMITIPLWTFLRGGKVTKRTDILLPLTLMLCVYWYFWLRIDTAPKCYDVYKNTPHLAQVCEITRAPADKIVIPDRKP